MKSKQFGNLLKEIRNGHLTQDAIAKRFGCHLNTIKNYENKGRVPDIEYLAVLSAESGYSFKELIYKRLLISQQENELPADLDVHQVCESGSLYELGSHNNTVKKFSAHNDAMAPTILSDAMVSYDSSRTELKDGQMFVFSFDSGHQIRRVQVTVTGAVNLLCDNAAYPSETVDKSDIDSLNVMGMVLSVTNFY